LQSWQRKYKGNVNDAELPLKETRRDVPVSRMRDRYAGNFQSVGGYPRPASDDF
jgi:hypothetical protein